MTKEELYRIYQAKHEDCTITLPLGSTWRTNTSAMVSRVVANDCFLNSAKYFTKIHSSQEQVLACARSAAHMWYTDIVWLKMGCISKDDPGGGCILIRDVVERFSDPGL